MEPYAVVNVVIWWIANIVTSISSKSVTEGYNDTGDDNILLWTPALVELKWVELTFFQHLVGGGLSVICLKLVVHKSTWTECSSKRVAFSASIAHFVGNLATNAAYAAMSSSSTQVVKACESVVILAISVLFFKRYEELAFSKLLWISIVLIGAMVVIMGDATFNILGLSAAVVSTLAFPIRNIFLAKIVESEHALQSYLVLSIVGTVFLLPVVTVKFALTKMFAVSLKACALSAIFHFVYNVASIYVFQTLGNLNHSALNLLKRVPVVAANIVYFRTTPTSWETLMGLFAFFAGLFFQSITSLFRSLQRSMHMKSQ